MKTYILKRPVYNSIDFPLGTIVKLLQEDHYNFVVVGGKLKGLKGCVADGLNGWVIDNTSKNKKALSIFVKTKKKLHSDIISLNKQWDKLPTSKLSIQKNN